MYYPGFVAEEVPAGTGIPEGGGGGGGGVGGREEGDYLKLCVCDR